MFVKKAIKYLAFIFVFIFMVTLISCDKNQKNDDISSYGNNDYTEYTIDENGNIISSDGTVYEYFSNETEVELLGEFCKIGIIDSEIVSDKYPWVYACKQDTEHIMIKINKKDDEWSSYYRKKSADTLDVSSENFSKIEFISYNEDVSTKASHFSCNEGILGNENVNNFLQIIKSGEKAEDAGLYESVKDKDGVYCNCYLLGKAYGFFNNEAAVVKPFNITSFNDQAYSITIDDIEYVLPKEYLIELGY